jgi:thiol-disulfide isomerase/thioredoxin
MKKTLYLLLLFALASFTTSNEPITISGKIINTTNGTIRITGESFEKEIKLKSDGSFSEKLNLEYDGIYALETSNNSTPIYLSKETKLLLTADNNAFIIGLKYSGKGSIENQYLAKKSILTSRTLDEELYKLNENDFLKKIKEIKTTLTALYNKTKFTDTKYKEKEATNIHYWEQNHLLIYQRLHLFFAGLKNFEVSDTYPQFDKKIDLDNDSDFLFSDEYKSIVLTEFFKNTKGDALSPYVSARHEIPKIKGLKSQSIKNRLIQNAITDIKIENFNYKELYEEYIFIITDTKLKENLTIAYNNTKKIENGNPSPKFDYENHKGGKTTLESLKGKYVYIDVWATWCGPCRMEIPSLKKLETHYKGKNIEFVSISIDKSEDHDKWSKLVTLEQLRGIQLLADKQWESQFIKDYGINAIPRFILIDPKGSIVNSQAPKPSDPKLIDLFNSLQL